MLDSLCGLYLNEQFQFTVDFLQENGVDKIFKLDRNDKTKTLGGCDK